MGFNTVVVLLNDFQGEIEKDGPLGARISRAMRNWFGHKPHGLSLNFGAGSVISCDHSSGEQVVVVSGNCGRRVDKANGLGWQALGDMKACLERHGYTVTKKRKAKASAALSEGTFHE